MNSLKSTIEKIKTYMDMVHDDDFKWTFLDFKKVPVNIKVFKENGKLYCRGNVFDFDTYKGLFEYCGFLAERLPTKEDHKSLFTDLDWTLEDGEVNDDQRKEAYDFVASLTYQYSMEGISILTSFMAFGILERQLKERKLWKRTIEKSLKPLVNDVEYDFICAMKRSRNNNGHGSGFNKEARKLSFGIPPSLRLLELFDCIYENKIKNA